MKISFQWYTLAINNCIIFDRAARPEQVFYGGEMKGESAMTYFDDIGTRVIHTYQVNNKLNNSLYVTNTDRIYTCDKRDILDIFVEQHLHLVTIHQVNILL